MSWSVNASGKPAEVKTALDSQFWRLSDAGERETVRLVSEAINQCLGTFGTDRSVSVSAFGHMGFQDWTMKAGAFQEVTITIKPIG
jgi:hypothetical protein